VGSALVLNPYCELMPESPFEGCFFLGETLFKKAAVSNSQLCLPAAGPNKRFPLSQTGGCVPASPADRLMGLSGFRPWSAAG
jgi:hypothetical protein